MNLSFLDFDASLAADGAGNFDAMATVSPGQRQALLEALAKSVAAWPQWQLKTNPERQESTTALTGGQGSAIDRAATDWRWCLVPRTPATEGTP